MISHSKISKKYANYINEIFSYEQDGYKIITRFWNEKHNRVFFLKHKNGNTIKAVFMSDRGSYSIFKNNKLVKTN